MPSLPVNIKFGSLGDYKLWAGDGWHHEPNDKDYTWADHMAKLRIMLEYTKEDLILKVDAIPITAKNIDQELFVFLNGSFVAHWPYRQASQQSARIEASLLKGRESLFTFVSPKALCPKTEGLGADERTLGLAFRSISLSAAQS